MALKVTITIEDYFTNRAVGAEDENASIAPKINFNFKTKITPAQYQQLYNAITNGLTATEIDS